MIKKQKACPPKRRGSGLVFAIILLFVILGIVVTLSGVTILETRMSQKTKSSVGAFYNSEAGVEWALYQITHKSGSDAISTIGGTVDTDGKAVKCPDFIGSDKCKVYFLDQNGQVLLASAAISQVKAVRSVGTQIAGDVTQRAIEATVAAGGEWTRSGTNLFPSNIGDNVGIGTSSPTAPLNVYQSAGKTEGIILSAPSASRTDFNIFNGSNRQFRIMGWGDGNTFIDFQSGKSLYFRNQFASGANMLVLQANGTTSFYGGNSELDASIDNNGVIWARGAKNFIIDHPLKQGFSLIHSSLEGPETAVYYRGEDQLVDGEKEVNLPEYFEKLTRKEGRTVQLTAKGDNPYNLSAGDIQDGKFKVFGTKANGLFYWEVKAIRADIPPLIIEKKK